MEIIVHSTHAAAIRTDELRGVIMVKGNVYAVCTSANVPIRYFFNISDAIEYCKERTKEYWELIHSNIDGYKTKIITKELNGKYYVGHKRTDGEDDYDYVIKKEDVY